MAGHIDRSTMIVLPDGTPVDEEHPLPSSAVVNATNINFTPRQGNLVDRSGTVTAGGVAQTLMVANPTRIYWFLQNNGTHDLWYNFTTDAAASEPSIRLPVGASYESPPHFVSPEKISIFGATTAQSYSAKEFST